MIDAWLTAALLLALSYLLGTIPSGVIVGRFLGNVDPRDYGSGRPGATNIWRTLGLRASIVVFLADAAKGALPVVGVRLLGGPLWLEAAAPLAAIAGHNWPVYLRFRGGRGVSTSAGGLLALTPGVGMAALSLFGIIVLLSRYASLGSLLGATLALALMLARTWMGQEPVEYAIFCSVAVGLIFFQHRDNMVRLIQGTERRLGRPETIKPSGGERD